MFCIEKKHILHSFAKSSFYLALKHNQQERTFVHFILIKLLNAVPNSLSIVIIGIHDDL